MKPVIRYSEAFMHNFSQNEIVLTDHGNPRDAARAVVLPTEGMTLRSFRLDDIEAICQTRAEQFAAYRKGFGPLIGPHFSQRKQLPKQSTTTMNQWAQTAALKQMGVHDPWQHGVGRYVPWDYTICSGKIRATLTGQRLINDVPLSDIQGGSFEMQLEMQTIGAALHINYTSTAAFPPIIGLHYYFNLPNGVGMVSAPVQGLMHHQSQASSIPEQWLNESGSRLELALDQELDHIFPLRHGPIELKTESHRVWIIPEKGAESLVVFHPAGEQWVCVEPLTTANPEQPTEHHVELTLLLMIES